MGLFGRGIGEESSSDRPGIKRPDVCACLKVLELGKDSPSDDISMSLRPRVREWLVTGDEWSEDGPVSSKVAVAGCGFGSGRSNDTRFLCLPGFLGTLETSSSKFGGCLLSSPSSVKTLSFGSVSVS